MGYGLEEAIEIAKEGHYTIYEGSNDKELGHYLMNEIYYDDVPDWLWNFIDYEGIGRDFTIGSSGVYIDSYYVVIE
jgi:hypothetical protein